MYNASIFSIFINKLKSIFLKNSHPSTCISERIQHESIPIVFICDNNYIIPTCVAITSLLHNKHQNTTYNIYIIADKIDEISTNLLNSFNSITQIRIIQCSSDEFLGFHTYSAGTYCQATISALMKFRIPDILQHLDKALYLDGDIIVQKDLSLLYATDIADNYAAVIKDSGLLYATDPNYENNREYFNSGVMLLNLSNLRNNNIPQRLIDAKKNSTDNTLMDQHVFNKIFKKNVKYLSLIYNFLYINLRRAKKNYSMDALNSLFETNYIDIESIIPDSYIIHFASRDKPWKKYDVVLVKEWEKYFNISPVKHIPLLRTSKRDK